MSEMVNRLARVVNSHSWTCVLSPGAIVFHRDRPRIAISTHASEEKARNAAEVLNARAALEAMREPTEAMETAAYRLDTAGMAWPCGADEIYQAMIDEALK